ncbi:hypothetical protein RDWZM_004290 [Blomia tropicalis]|uniref:Uncharacterized protein n=1 Tax=Blomia tropicalis TaxID=40697 RepID=A0A9Q0RTH4_BLOTA|nr:hypothetical protein RDWZM_004290 [Blomia tropicalis]
MRLLRLLQIGLAILFVLWSIRLIVFIIGDNYPKTENESIESDDIHRVRYLGQRVELPVPVEETTQPKSSSSPITTEDGLMITFTEVITDDYVSMNSIIPTTTDQPQSTFEPLTHKSRIDLDETTTKELHAETDSPIEENISNINTPLNSVESETMETESPTTIEFTTNSQPNYDETITTQPSSSLSSINTIEEIDETTTNILEETLPSSVPMTTISPNRDDNENDESNEHSTNSIDSLSETYEKTPNEDSMQGSITTTPNSMISSIEPETIDSITSTEFESDATSGTDGIESTLIPISTTTTTINTNIDDQPLDQPTTNVQSTTSRPSLSETTLNIIPVTSSSNDRTNSVQTISTKHGTKIVTNRPNHHWWTNGPIPSWTNQYPQWITNRNPTSVNQIMEIWERINRLQIEFGLNKARRKTIQNTLIRSLYQYYNAVGNEIITISRWMDTVKQYTNISEITRLNHMMQLTNEYMQKLIRYQEYDGLMN